MKIKTLLLVLILLFTLQSCFDIVEEVRMKNDGSGTFLFTLNLSKSKTEVNSILKMKKINGHNVPSKTEINNQIAEIEKILKNTTGISQVTTTKDFSNYIFEMSCNFKNITNLNDAISNLKKNKKIDAKIPSEYFSYANKKLVRTHKIAMKEMYEKVGKADKEAFKDANYTAIYKFESEIISVSNKNSVVSKSKKAVKISSSVLDLIYGTKKIENTITLK